MKMFNCIVLSLSLGAIACLAQTKSTPALDALPLFTAANVPKVGTEELPIDPPRWTVSTNETEPSFPGEGLARHPMLYIGEGCNTMFLVSNGKVIWTTRRGKAGSTTIYGCSPTAGETQ